MKAAFKAAGLSLRCEAKQPHDYISRIKKKRGVQKVRQTKLLVGQVTNMIAPLQIPNLEDLFALRLPMSQLVVLPGALVDERVCIVFACRGMFARGRAAQSKVIKLAVDGKQKIVAND